jgi:hypothetical protein
MKYSWKSASSDHCWWVLYLPSIRSIRRLISVATQEYEKLITFTGTPTVAWRRTGEICLVGAEFSMLTDWTRDELVGAKKYIWEVRFVV